METKILDIAKIIMPESRCVTPAIPVAREIYTAHFNPLEDELSAAKDRERVLVDALEDMCSMWRGVCGPQGWEPEHLCEYEQARAALASVKGE